MKASTSETLREVRSRDWSAFCERLNELEGAIATIELIDLQGMKTEIAHNAQIERVSFGKLDACSDEILIRVRDKHVIEHRIVDPLHVKVEETEGGRDFDAAFLEGENGTTVLTMHPVIHASQLAGIRLR